jgi:hypothetical protein
VLSLSDSSVAIIETIECGEDLVELRSVHERLFVDDSEANAICIGYRPIFLTRKSVAVKLRQGVQSVPVVNYPFEWWYWSYGDKYWAAVSGAESAVYGPLHAPEGYPAIVR